MTVSIEPFAQLEQMSQYMLRLFAKAGRRSGMPVGEETLAQEALYGVRIFKRRTVGFCGEEMYMGFTDLSELLVDIGMASSRREAEREVVPQMTREMEAQGEFQLPALGRYFGMDRKRRNGVVEYRIRFERIPR